jgi:replicative DNA helicase
MDEIKNVQNEILIVGCFYKDANLYVEYNKFIKSKYDFFDECTKFFYENGEIIFKKRTQNFNENNILLYMSEDEERFKKFKKFGGWKLLEEWMELAALEDFKSYFEVLKKYSLLREYARNGFNVQKIIDHPKFNLFGALDVYKLIRSKTDKIQTVILTNNEAHILNEEMTKVIDGCLEVPDMGLAFPFPILNDLFRGIRSKTMMSVAMLSNFGKSRLMFKVIAYIALVQKQKVFVLLNEMNLQDMKLALLVTVLNNPEFSYLHGYDIHKKEREIALGLYKNDNGEFIYREKDDAGNYTESIKEFTKRLKKESKEYRIVVEVAKWIEEESNGLIYAMDVSTDYSFENLEHQMRKMKMIYSINYAFYDTLKNPINAVGDWSALKEVTTKLRELAAELDIWLYCSQQLSDDSNFTPPMDLNSSNIASAKHTVHVLDQMIMFKEVEKEDFHKYYYLENNPGWGTPHECNFDLNKKHYIAVVQKNRAGARKKLAFSVDLDENVWLELGEVFKK